MKFEPLYFSIAFAVCFLFSCTTSKGPLNVKSSPHEKYAKALTDAGLGQTQLAQEWISAADSALKNPLPITLPYQETGYFADEKPSAAGLLFSAKKGEKIIATLSTIPASGVVFFMELWKQEGDQFTLLALTDTTHRINYVVKNDGQYRLRLQPELLRSMEYTIIIHTEPSLAFPVDSAGNPRIISTWGVDRDGGLRRHEGADIAAKFRTPALAATDGYITRSNENSLGGKVVFLYDREEGFSLYYAHLDTQIVQQGQSVKSGDVVGLIGNTGNARNTIPHLHFGIYTTNGAIDPLSFIYKKTSSIKPITASVKALNNWVRTTSSAKVYESAYTSSRSIKELLQGEVAFISAATGDWYKINYPMMNKVL
jgi:murein DD-endopeptidase MepM/ murein hydrolase activator NlpD